MIQKYSRFQSLRKISSVNQWQVQLIILPMTLRILRIIHIILIMSIWTNKKEKTMSKRNKCNKSQMKFKMKFCLTKETSILLKLIKKCFQSSNKQLHQSSMKVNLTTSLMPLKKLVKLTYKLNQLSLLKWLKRSFRCWVKVKNPSWMLTFLPSITSLVFPNLYSTGL